METTTATTDVQTAAATPEVSPPPAASPSKPFRHAGLLAEAELRKLRERHEGFVRALVARLSTYLRMDFGLELVGFKTITFQNFVERMVTPTHLTLFKADPLRGIGVLDMPPKLGLAIVERLLGGAGRVDTAPDRPLTEIETALLDQIEDLLLGEWCHQWHDLQQFKHALLGHEIEGRFLNTTARNTMMLEVLLEACLGDSKQQCRIGFPYHSLEPLIRRLSGESSPAPTEHAPSASPKLQWKAAFDNVPVAVTAVISGLESTARELANLKVGDTLALNSQRLNEVQIQLVNTPKFIGTLGKIDGVWAVKLTQALGELIT